MFLQNNNIFVKVQAMLVEREKNPKGKFKPIVKKMWSVYSQIFL